MTEPEAAIAQEPRLLQGPRLILLLTVLVALGPLSTDLYLPSLPGLARDFAVDAATAQLTLSAFLAGFAGAMLIYGPLADRFGRRPTMLGGLAIYALASMAIALTESIEMLILLRFLQALGACAGPVICRAIVRDVYGADGASRALSYLAAAMALAPAVGPIIGGFIAEWVGWRGNFWFLAVYGFLGLALVTAALPETNRFLGAVSIKPLEIARSYWDLTTSPRYMGFVLCAAFGYSGIFCFISGSSFVFIDVLGVAPRWFGLCFTVFVLGYLTGAISSARLHRRLGSDRLMSIGASLALSGATLLVLIGLYHQSVPGLLAPLFLYMIGIGMCLPNVQAGAIVPFPQKAATASAFLGFNQMLIASLVGAALGQINAASALPMSVSIFAMTSALGLAYWGIVRRRA